MTFHWLRPDSLTAQALDRQGEEVLLLFVLGCHHRMWMLSLLYFNWGFCLLIFTILTSILAKWLLKQWPLYIHRLARVEKSKTKQLSLFCSLKKSYFFFHCTSYEFLSNIRCSQGFSTLSVVLFLAHLGFPKSSLREQYLPMALLLELCEYIHINLILGCLKDDITLRDNILL